tara:strand:- start:799433 stop:801130 length:1698 start_codon:yes stop_codon:yes gene_type:complete
MKPYIKNFKKLWNGSVTFLLIVIFISCEDDLQEVPLDFISVSTAFENPSDAETGVTGLYSLAREWYSGVNQKWMFVYVALGTDQAYFGEDPGGGYMSNWDVEITPDSDLPERYWTNAFDLVYQSNIVLDGIDQISFDNEDQKNKLLAEARFFRAFAYRILVILYGDVPMVTEPITSPKIDFTRIAKEEIYSLIIEDLGFAGNYLPIKGGEEAPGRLTQGAAWHFLSEAYLAIGEFESAKQAATKVIEDYGYALMTQRFGNQTDYFGSENVYTDLFTMDNHNLNTNTEGIWVIQNDPDIIGGGFYAGERAFGCAYYRMGNTPDGFTAVRGDLFDGNYTGYWNAFGRPVAWARPTNYMSYDIWKEDWDTDLRNTEANIKRTFYFDNPESAFDGQPIDWNLYESRSSALKDTTQYIYPYFMKVAAPYDHYTDPNRAGGGINHKDLYAIRLAETYLLRAEANLGLSDLAAAASDINTVRRRSNASEIDASRVDINFILDERSRELYTEEWRLLTLMRLGKLVERVQTYNDNPLNPGVGILEHHRLWPIPQSDIDFNTGAELVQNPGYTN